MIPFIDIFAGPGGLGEGFSAFKNEGNFQFRSALSIEKDEKAHQTLLLRSFLRQFRHNGRNFPEEYYKLLKKTPFEFGILYEKYPDEFEAAKTEAQRIELGGKGPNNTAENVDRLIRNAVGQEPFWGLLGGPPCQAYSNIGKARIGKEKASKDPKTELYRHYLRILAVHSPSFFIFENVRGISSTKKKGVNIFEKICRDLQDPCRAFRKESFTTRPKYKLYAFASYDGQIHISKFGDHKVFQIECEKFGIPQQRHRIIVLGILDQNIGARISRLGSHKAVSVKDVIWGLPKLRSGLSKQDSDLDWARVVAAAIDDFKKAGIPLPINLRNLASVKIPSANRGGEYLRYKAKVNHAKDWYLDENLTGVLNHNTRGHLPMDLFRYLYYASEGLRTRVSPKLSTIPEWLLPEHKNAKSGKFDDRFRVQLWGKPANTITSHISKDGHYFIHPDPKQCRSFTVREAARIQTFPDNYFFCGPKTSQYVQVGNAVPPLLARQMAEVVYDWAKTASLVG